MSMRGLLWRVGVFILSVPGFLLMLGVVGVVFPGRGALYRPGLYPLITVLMLAYLALAVLYFACNSLPIGLGKTVRVAITILAVVGLLASAGLGFILVLERFR